MIIDDDLTTANGDGTAPSHQLPVGPSTSLDAETHRWHLLIYGWRHRVEVRGSSTRTLSWYVDDQLVASKKTSENDVHLEPGRGHVAVEAARKGSSGGPASLDAPLADATAPEHSDLGTIRVNLTDFGRVRRVTWHEGEADFAATVRAMAGIGGIDLDPESGSPAALRAERIRRHPRRYAALAVAGGIAKVVVPLLVGFLVIRLTVSISWPNWNLPPIPLPDLPAIPWPDIHLPHWQAPAWVTWLVDRLRYVGPVILAAIIARTEIRRQRRQDALKAQLKAAATSAGADDGH